MSQTSATCARWPRKMHAIMLASATLICVSAIAPAHASDWPSYSYDDRNSNFNPRANQITPHNARYLRRAWEVFNDDTLVPEPPPTGFALESALGLEFPSSVVGVIAGPIVRDETLYYVDALGTLFARDARTGQMLDPAMHWATTLVDPDFDAGNPPPSPELYYTAPIVTDDHVWLVGAVYGRVHLVDRIGGNEIDFDPSTPEIDPFRLAPDRALASVLGEPVIVNTDDRTLLVVSLNVIVNDALLQGGETGLSIAYDISDPTAPVEYWRSPTVDTNPDTGSPFVTGVSAGAGLAIDLQRNLLFGGTGQNTSVPYDGYPDAEFAPAGYVDRSDSLYAIDIDTGEFAWTNQFHAGDVFNLNAPVSTGPNQPDGPRDADVLSPPILFRARVRGQWRDLAGNGSKGGLFRVVDRDSGDTVWERQISKPTGIGGIQAGAAVAQGTIYVAGFEGIDDAFSDHQFGTSLETGLFPNAFFATFSPAFWADVEDTTPDNDPATGMRVKVYALSASTGRSRWHFPGGRDYVELPAGAALRHVSVSKRLVYVTTSSGRLFVLDARTGHVVFEDQTPDLNERFSLGLGKPHHASMNGGTVLTEDMVYVPFGAQNEPSGGLYAYELNRRPNAHNDVVNVARGQTIRIDALANDDDPNGDALRFTRVAGQRIRSEDGLPDRIFLWFGWMTVVNPGDDPEDPTAAYIDFTPSSWFHGQRNFHYVVEDIAPHRIINGSETDEPNPTHRSRRDVARIQLRLGA